MLTPIQLKVLGSLSDRPLSFSSLCDRAGVSDGAARKAIHNLCHRGLAARSVSGWSLTTTGRREANKRVHRDHLWKSEHKATEGEDEAMGSIRKMTKAELRRHERNQHAPEFLEWLGGGEAALATFFAEDAPEIGALPDPWTREGLRLLGANIRVRFVEPPALKDPANSQAVSRYSRYLGEVYCRTVEAEWRNVPENGPGDPMWPVLSEPFRMLYLDVHQQLYGAFVKSTRKRTVHPDGEIAWVYDNSKRDYAEWVSAGKPDREAWQKLTLERLMSQAQDLDM